MLVLATFIDWANALPIIIGLFGLGSIIFTALKYNRDDTTSVVTQQNVIVSDMKTLNEELRTRTQELREERDGLKGQVDELTRQIQALRHELGRIDT
jgi:predicted RNase H-like nuclease (RuvC/YqgF family)